MRYILLFSLVVFWWSSPPSSPSTGRVVRNGPWVSGFASTPALVKNFSTQPRRFASWTQSFAKIRRGRGILVRREAHSNPTTSSSSSSSTTSPGDVGNAKALQVVLMGVGDLRLDDHLGWHRALQASCGLEGAATDASGNREASLPISTTTTTTTATSAVGLIVLSDEMLANIPGAVAHTADTAALLHAACTDLQQILSAKDIPLYVECISSSVSSHRDQEGDSYSHHGRTDMRAFLRQWFESIRGQPPYTGLDRMCVHVCDLGPADRGLGYGPCSSLGVLTPPDETDNVHPDENNLEESWLQIIPWQDVLRDEPWQQLGRDVASLSYTDYSATYVTARQPLLPLTDSACTAMPQAASAMRPADKVPSVEELTQRIMDWYPNLVTPDRVRAERGTGLYATHWGGLDPSTATSTAVLQTIRSYVQECQQDDVFWSQHPSYVERYLRRNGRSLEHAAMVWQLRGEGKNPAGTVTNWMAGEGMIRYLAAPLLLGTISMRRIWHTAADDSTMRFLFYSSPLQQLVETREWHRILAARQLGSSTRTYLMNDGPNQGQPQCRYLYWRYHGYLCRYLAANLRSPSRMSEETSAEKEGVLLVHGFGASGTQWTKTMQELGNCAENTAVEGLAPDLIGFGQSEKPALSYTGYMWDGMLMDFVKERAMARHGWNSFTTGGNSIGGFTCMSLAACDTATVNGREVSSTGSPGTGRCTGVVLMNSAGPVQTLAEVQAIQQTGKELQLESVAQVTALDALPACKPPARPLARFFGNVLLWYLRPRIQSICRNLYPTNPAAVDGSLCENILRDSLDPGAIYVMMAGAKLPPPRTANELLKADFGSAQPRAGQIEESCFDGSVLIAQGVLDPLNNATDRMNRFASLRSTIEPDPIQAGHCPHDELPDQVAQSMASWMSRTLKSRNTRLKTEPLSDRRVASKSVSNS